MAVERLTSADEVMLWADESWPQEIGALAILDGTIALDAARRAVAGRLHLASRLRQRILVPPKELGRPLWIDAADFDLANHVRTAEVEAPGEEAQILAAVERVRRRRLDRERPLWEMWFLTGLAQRRVAIYVRAHHAIADGMAGISILGGLFDLDADRPPAADEPWSPQPAPAESELIADELASRRVSRSRRIDAVTHPARTLAQTATVLPALRELFAERAVPSTSLDSRIGADREVALVRTDLALMKDAAHDRGATVNDALLTVLAGGLRRLMLSRGERVDGQVIRVYVPVSLRHGDYGGARGNEIAQMMVPLPVGVADPCERLPLIAAETTLRKARVRPSVGGMRLSGIAGRALIGLINRQHVNVETADLPGPPVPLYFAGARLMEMFPLLPLIGRVSVGAGALSYAGQFNIGLVADAGTQGDIEILAAGMREELKTLRLEQAVARSA